MQSKKKPEIIEDLRSNSERSNDALRYMTKSCRDKELDKRLCDKTRREVERDWLLCPLPWNSLKEDATLSRGFPLEQAGQVRPIDDLSQGQINSTATCYEQATVDGPVVIHAFATYMVRRLADNGRSTKLVGRSWTWPRPTVSLL